MKPALTAILGLMALPGHAHRLDEYLQATLVSVEKTRLNAELTLTAGVAVFPIVRAAIDTNGDGVISESEQHAYAERVLRDVSLTIDGQPLTPHLVSTKFSSIEDPIQIQFNAELPTGGSARSLVIDNHHLSQIAAYQVNSLVPTDPSIRIVAQKRNYLQSHYQMEYTQPGVNSWMLQGGVLGAMALVLFARFGLLWRRRVSTA